MAQIYLTRHGETEMNVNKVYYGKLDVKLNENGIKQCEKLREKLSGIFFDEVISSSLIRAIESASIISSFEKKAIIKDSSLNEIDFGEWEGLNYQYISTNYYEAYREWAQDWSNFCFPGGESFTQFKIRIFAFAEKFIEDCRGKTIMINAHQGSLKLLMIALLGLEEGAFWKLSFDFGKYSLIEINDIYPVLRCLNR